MSSYKVNNCRDLKAEVGCSPEIDPLQIASRITSKSRSVNLESEKNTGNNMRTRRRCALCYAAAGNRQEGQSVKRVSTSCGICKKPYCLRRHMYLVCQECTDKKENKIFLTYKEIHNGAVAKSYMTNGLLIYGEIFAHFLIY
jgi:hypothetical protein